MNEEDKRVIRTRSKLAKALIELSCEEGYEAVTVQSIAERAGIHYRTFYRHYDSKDDLLQDVLRSTMAELYKVMPPPTPAELRDANYGQIAREKWGDLYELVAENRKFFRVLLQSGPAALESVQATVQAKAEGFIADLPEVTVPDRLIAFHMITSSLSLIQWWLEHDMPYTPEQMGDYTAQLIMLPIRRLLVEYA
jgi:AcrR family transcriptional regulator